MVSIHRQPLLDMIERSNKLVENASPGSWTQGDDSYPESSPTEVYSADDPARSSTKIADTQFVEDSEFIVHARDYIPCINDAIFELLDSADIMDSAADLYTVEARLATRQATSLIRRTLAHSFRGIIAQNEETDEGTAEESDA